MQAHDGSAQMHSVLGSNNQQGDVGASQTSDNAVNNQSPQTGCCCKPVEALAGAAPIVPSYHAPACQSCGIMFGGNIPPVCYTEHGRLWFCTSGYRRQHTAPPPGPMLSSHSYCSATLRVSPKLL